MRTFHGIPWTRGVPGQLPLLNFPEISMWGQNPWGGYGANPLPGRLQRLWNQTQHKLAGGFPYSEGIYEDINKVICSQLYWDGYRPTLDAVKDYIAFEFSPDVVDTVAQAIQYPGNESPAQQHLPERGASFRPGREGGSKTNAAGAQGMALANPLPPRGD